VDVEPFGETGSVGLLRLGPHVGVWGVCIENRKEVEMERCEGIVREEVVLCGGVWVRL
jgi:hypothetical protein